MFKFVSDLIFTIMTTDSKRTITIGGIVADDYRAAAIFKKAGIDFCCGGNKSLEVACEEKNADIQIVSSELEALKLSPVNPQFDFKNWDPGFLCDYIVNTHHQYVTKTLPELVFYTEKIAHVHGEHHPELVEVASLFTEINRELLQHLKNEEEVLFPAIKAVLKGNQAALRVGNEAVNGGNEGVNAENVVAKSTIVSEIARMSGEHEFAGGAMDRINELTRGYALPEDACNTYLVAFKMLEAFEDDLHTHVHLENNILYPKALAMAE